MNHFHSLLSKIVRFTSGASQAAYLRVRAIREDQRGNIAIATALAMPVLIGGTGLGVEVGYWYFQKQAMQSAADSAAVAAATAGGPSYDEEARAVAARYGFTHGHKQVSVNASNNA